MTTCPSPIQHNALAQAIEASLRTIPDYPKPGIQFKDMTTLLTDGSLFKQCIDALAHEVRGLDAQAILGVEARGFIVGAAAAYALGLPFVPVRKQGKLPAATFKQTYELEYGHDTLELHQQALPAGHRVVIMDDLLATGGTVRATCQLAQQAELNVVGALFVMELNALAGRQVLADHVPNVVSLLPIA
jgi:adenine phosphoribosyltransferase